MTPASCASCWYWFDRDRDDACARHHRHVCDNERSAWYGSRVAPDHVCDEHSPASVRTDADDDEHQTTGDA